MKDLIKSNYLFNEIIKIIKEKGVFPDIIDYAIPCDEVLIDTPEFYITNGLDYGGSEGIYLDLYLNFYDAERREQRNVRFGCIKTLYDDAAAMHTMANLLADIMVASREYVNKNYALFDRRGFRISGFRENDEKLSTCYLADTLEKARDRVACIIRSYPDIKYVIITNKRTGEGLKEKIA